MTATLDSPPRAALWEHQEQALRFADGKPGVLLAIGMGGGKSRIAIELAEQRHAMRTLVLCPKSVVGVWPSQIAEHGERDWRVWAGEVIGAFGKPLANPTVSRRVEALIEHEKGALLLGVPHAAIVNYEASRAKQMRALLLGTPWDAVILDESHRIKAPGGTDSRFLASLGERVRARGGKAIALTGTPMPHSPLDIYAQYRALDPSIFGTNNSLFRARYAGRKARIARGGESIFILGATNATITVTIEERLGGFAVLVDGRETGVFDDREDAEADAGAQCAEALWIVGREPKGRVLRRARPGERIYLVGPRLEPLYEGIAEARQDAFTDRLGRIMFHVPQDELDAKLGLPETVDVHRTVDLEPATRRAYETMERDLIADVGAGVVTAANAMVLTTRLAQLSGGFSKDVDGNIVHAVDPPEKARLLADVLEDLDEPVVVFARFHADLDAVRGVAEKLGRSYGELSGRRRDGLTDESRMAPVDVMACQLQSGGVGIDLTRARVCVFYSLDFRLAEYEQSRKRIHRPGQTRQVLYVHLLATDTIDHAVFGALRKRQDVIHAVMGRLNEGSTP